MTKADVCDEFRRRREARRGCAEELAATDRRIADVRLGLFVAGAVVAWAVLAGPRIAGAWLWLPIGAFAVLVVRHELVRRRLQAAERATWHYERSLERVEERWAGKGNAGARYADPAHPCAGDLDLFGRGSLYERLCTARTRPGEDALAAWLREPASPAEVRARQEAAADLAPRLDLREDLAVRGEEAGSALDPALLISWSREGSGLDAPSLRWGLLLLAAASAATLLGWGFSDWGPEPFVFVLIPLAGVDRLLRHKVRAVAGTVNEPARELELVADLLHRLEIETFTSPRLIDLKSRLADQGRPASAAIGALVRRVRWYEASRNPLFALLGWLILWDPLWASTIEAWRVRHGVAVERWLRALGEFEALVALAAYAYERPADVVPALEDGPPRFEAEALGHPLIPDDTRVCNDVSLGGETRLLLVSGSNMSGKSTLLRAVGVAVVLAQAGAPVCARRLRLSPLSVGATLRIQDSLQEGHSRFYAEIQRLRLIVDLAAAPRPLLFLLDEILHGTNSHDRRTGAEGVVRGLLQRGALGIVTTHDLALAEMVAGLGAQARNVHFEDQWVDGRMLFDYRMRPGVVQRSNALALMRAVGLDV